MTLRDEAEELAIALTLGFATVDEVVRWADTEIGARDDVPRALIDVSCAAALPAVEVVHLLRTMPGRLDIQRASRRVIRRMASAFDTDHASAEHIARALYTMYIEGWTPDKEAASEMAGFDEELSLARSGIYGSAEEVTGHLREFLRRHES